MNSFERGADGRLVFTLFEGNAEVLELLMQELAMFLRSPEPDARATDRLFPRAYLDPTEDTSEGEWQSLVHDDLVKNKLAAFDDVAALLAASSTGADGLVHVALSAAQENALLLAVNDARLTLAALAGDDPDPSDAHGLVARPRGRVVRAPALGASRDRGRRAGGWAGPVPGLTGAGPFGTPLPVP